MVASEKIEAVENLTEKLRRCQSVIVTDFKGITVHDVTQLRSQLRAQSVEMRVMKNRLIKRKTIGANWLTIASHADRSPCWARTISSRSNSIYVAQFDGVTDSRFCI